MSYEINISGAINAKQVAVGTNATAIMNREKDMSIELKNIEKQIEKLNLIFLDYKTQLNNVAELIEVTSTVKTELNKDKPNKPKINKSLENLALMASSVPIIAKMVDSLIETIHMVI